jgi:hypothetical protein
MMPKPVHRASIPKKRPSPVRERGVCAEESDEAFAVIRLALRFNDRVSGISDSP